MAHRILLVDDEPSTREVLARLLERAGHDVFAVSSVPEAEAVLAEAPPDLLITDVRVETYNGLQLIAMAPARCAAIVITGFTDPAVEADARRLGAECLLKPVASAVLYATVDRTLEKRAQRPRPDGRREARTSLPIPLSISGVGTKGRLLAVSGQGARLELEMRVSATLSDTLSFEIDSVGISVVATIAWKRYHADLIECGVFITEASQPAWRAFLASLPTSVQEQDIPLA